MKANCISCQEMITVGAHSQLGTFVICPKCDARLEVIWLAPLELDWPTEDFIHEDYFEDEYKGEL